MANTKTSTKKRRWIQLLIFIAISAALYQFFTSSISKVKQIDIQGQRFTDMTEIEQVLHVNVGDSFFTSFSWSLEKKIKKLPTIESVEVTKTFPGKINVTVSEYPPVAYEITANGDLLVNLANGYSISNGADNVVDKPIFTGWDKYPSQKVDLCKQLAQIPTTMISDFSQVIPIPSVAYPDRIKIYTRSKFILITSISLLTSKMNTFEEIVEMQPPGVVTMLLADSYRAF